MDVDVTVELIQEKKHSFTPVAMGYEDPIAPPTGPVYVVGKTHMVPVRARAVNQFTGPRRSGPPRLAADHLALVPVVPRLRTFGSRKERALAGITLAAFIACSLFAVWGAQATEVFA